MSRECIFISGLCQSRKTQKTLDVIAGIETHNEPTLLLYITQSGSTLNAFQVIQRIKAHDVLGRLFPSVLRAAQSRIKPLSNTAIVDFYHKNNMKAMNAMVNATNWSHVICIIDEADQGALSGFRGRLNVLRDLDSNTRGRLYTIFVTATVPNLCRLFSAEESKVDTDGSFVSRLLSNDLPVRHLFVTPHETYVSLEWFFVNKRVSIMPGVGHLLEKGAVKKSLTQEAAIEQLRKLAARQRRLLLISFTNSKQEQSQVAEALVKKGDVDIAVCLNSENVKNYSVYYSSSHGKAVGTWAIPYGTMMRAANKGRFANHVTDSGDVIETGLDSAHDMSLSHVLFTGLLTNEDFARANGRAAAYVRPQLIALRNFLTDKRPSDYPKCRNARIAIIGGNMLSRGITIQDPNIGFTCTAFVFMDSGKASNFTDAGASHTQKAGRALGNMLDFFEGSASGNVPPIMVISAPLFVSALSNERLTYQRGCDNDGAMIDVKNYISREDYRAMVAVVKREVGV